MTVLEELGTSWTTLGLVVLGAIGVYVAVIALTRLAGVHSRDQVRAVIMETTGDMSVLRRGDPFDDELLQGVRGGEALR